jgi:glycosyltransferase involved in cell wall biosynthesis
MSHAAGERAPLVSVVIPAYNVGRYIAETLESVFAQRFRDFEVLVVNDGSPDTPELERALAPYLDRITYIVQQNAGPSAARNTAIRRARGTWLAFLDGDDRWLPDCLEDQMARASADPSLAVVFADAVIFEDPELAGKTLRTLGGAQMDVDFLGLVTERCTITTSCAMIRRDVCIEAGMFDAALRRSEDFDLWLRIAHAGGRFDGSMKVLAEYRRNGTGASTDLDAMADAMIAVFDKCVRTLTLTQEEREVIARARIRQHAEKKFLEGKRAFVDGDFRRARQALGEANAVMRSRKLALVVRGLSLAPSVLARLYSLRSIRL